MLVKYVKVREINYLLKCILLYGGGETISF